MNLRTHDNQAWSYMKKLGFRTLFVFFVLIILPFPLGTLPGGIAIVTPYHELWTLAIKWVGETMFNQTENLESVMTGSGDKLYDWLRYVVVFFITLLAVIVWTVLDRERKDYRTLSRWLALYVSFYLMYFMLVYGIIKVFYLQFRAPDLETLFQTYGQSSPMRLLWTFMGFSKSYTMFAGACETVAGILLMFRRTRTLGGLVAAGVMLNVFMMNMSYDVPVKLFSFQLMIMGLYIALQDAEKLYLFMMNRPVPAKKYVPTIENKRGNAILITIQGLFIGYFVISQVIGSVSGQKQYGEKRERSPLYGVYEAETFVQNGDTLAPLITDTIRWRRMLLDYPNFTSIIKMNDSMVRYSSSVDTLHQTITLSAFQDTTNKYTLNYEKTNGGLNVEGVLFADTLAISFIYYDRESFSLVARGFNWINQVPYNRYAYE